jgi:hypothetical protein
MTLSHYIEVGSHQIKKEGQQICGDVHQSTRLAGEGRVVSCVADGLGSGIKANVLATLTSTMATKFAMSHIDVRRAAEIIMQTLPICSTRQIGYSTFTIVDTHLNGATSIIEHDNPFCLHFRDGKAQPITREQIELTSTFNGRHVQLWMSKMELRPEDRLVIFSDGVTQAGIGSKRMPLGQGERHVIATIEKILAENPFLAASDLARQVVASAVALDQYRAKDDTTCQVIYFRKPRKTLIVSGPPFDESRDAELASYLKEFSGKKIICGGTTASILARELGLSVTVNLSSLNHDTPPESKMPGIDLVTEGTITLSKLIANLRRTPFTSFSGNSTIDQLTSTLMSSDIIQIIVGTKINVAHHDPRLPQELEIRRNVMKAIAQLLEERYLKQVELSFI